jgi:hypothetical protein
MQTLKQLCMLWTRLHVKQMYQQKAAHQRITGVLGNHSRYIISMHDLWDVDVSDSIKPCS